MGIRNRWDLWFAHINNSVYALIASFAFGLVATLLTVAITSLEPLAIGAGIVVFLVVAFFSLRFIWKGGFLIRTESEEPPESQA